MIANKLWGITDRYEGGDNFFFCSFDSRTYSNLVVFTVCNDDPEYLRLVLSTCSTHTFRGKRGNSGEGLRVCEHKVIVWTFILYYIW
jgi:hypothetical protein